MRYNFDEITDRRGSNCVKWDLAKDGVIPMWVADMDFKVAPCIQEAIMRRAEHGIFGYTNVPVSYYEAIVNWFMRRHNWRIKAEWIIYTSGVVPAVSAIIKAMTQPGDKVLIQTPVYNCFFSSIRNNGCQIEESPLKQVTSDDGMPTFVVDWEDFETRIADPKTKVFLLCNPHNPAGRVWTKEELRRMGDICLSHGVFVISDEIHCELTMPGIDYTPYGSLGEKYMDNAAVCTSPSKAFNIAGLQNANITISNEATRQRVDKAINVNEVCDVNPFGVAALIAAYNEGAEWLDQLREYIAQSYKITVDFFADNLPQLTVCKLEGTYLLWVNCAATGLTGKEFCQKIMKQEKVWFNNGEMYGEAGKDFFRINLACPHAQIREALGRLKHFVETNIGN